MKIHLEPARRGETPPAWIFVGIGLLLLGAGVFLVMEVLPQGLRPACGFHAVTGKPCPTCGMTRSLGALFHGRLREALRLNPLAAVVFGILALWVAAGALSRLAGRNLRVETTPREERLLWVLLLLAFLGNWAYLWVAGL
ncbi:MAG: DUF2752 domain-containing protein [Acidobacteriota bacterium]